MPPPPQPGNLMLTDSDHILLADLGSVAESRVPITCRKEAVALQELAAVNCTSPYRAPELFEVRSKVVGYLSVTIWVDTGKSYLLQYLKLNDVVTDMALVIPVLSGQVLRWGTFWRPQPNLASTLFFANLINGRFVIFSKLIPVIVCKQ